MNTKGKLVIPAVYDVMRDPDDKYNETWSKPVADGRILVSKGGNFGIIDINNKVTFPFSNKYQTIESFSVGATYFNFYDGIAEVATINDNIVCISKSDKEVNCR